MKNFVLISIFYFNFSFCFAYTTEVSRFAEKQYANNNCLAKVHINVKKEHTIENRQNIGGLEDSKITFGYGDIKTKEKQYGKKKLNISYICLLDKNCKPFWSCIIPTK